MCVEPSRSFVRSDRGLQQTAMTAGRNERREDVWGGAPRRCKSQQSHHRILRSPHIDIHLGTKTVSRREVRVQCERTSERRFGQRHVFGPDLDRSQRRVIGHHIRDLGGCVHGASNGALVVAHCVTVGAPVRAW